MSNKTMKHGPCFLPGPLLVPGAQIPVEQWACPAANWFGPEAWREMEAMGAAPSVRQLLVPDAFLDKVETGRRLHQALRAQRELEAAALTRTVEGFVYLERTLPDGRVRRGLVGLVDLEQYGFSAGAEGPVRAPVALAARQVLPKLELLEDAVLQSSHILLAADAQEDELFAPLEGRQGEPLYEGDLCYGGGSVKGWAVEDAGELAALEAVFSRLADRERFASRWPQAPENAAPAALVPVNGGADLAAAKAHWVLVKEELPEEAWQDHPARYCLAEVCSLYSPAIRLRGMHRLVLGVQGLPLAAAFRQWCAGQGVRLLDEPPAEGENSGRLRFVYGGWQRDFWPVQSRWPLAAGVLDAFLEDYMHQNPMCSLDYLASEEELRELAADGNSGVLLPDVKNSDLFRGLAAGGFLPRRPFALGTAQEQRYELECRRIR